jgi:hypothetical protein
LRHKHARARQQRQLTAVEQQPRGAGAQRGLQRVQRLRDDAQHLQLQAVELVQAGKRAALRQAP